ncbi:MAG: hypothetical protein ACRDE7_10670 [Sphingobacterium sp.]
MEYRKQQQLIEDTSLKGGNGRRRLITYLKDNIITIDTECIMYIILHENMVSEFTSNNKSYNLNTSLYDLMKELDNDIFIEPIANSLLMY